MYGKLMNFSVFSFKFQFVGRYKYFTLLAVQTRSNILRNRDNRIQTYNRLTVYETILNVLLIHNY